MKDLVITHSSGTRTLTVHRVRPTARSYARATNEAKFATGDGLETPSTFTTEIQLREATIAATTALAYTIIEEAQNATQVEYQRDTITVDKLRAHSMRAEAKTVFLTLTWRVTKPGLVPLSWDGSSVTWDQTDVTFDTERIAG